MKKILLLSWILCVLLTACANAGISATPTSTLPPVPSSTATPTASPTETPIPTATATIELTLEEQYGHLVPSDAKLIAKPIYAGEWFGSPPGTKFVDVQLFSTGEWVMDQTSGVMKIRLLFKDKNGVTNDIWMKYADENFGSNHDGTSFHQISVKDGGSRMITGKPEDLIKKSNLELKFL